MSVPSQSYTEQYEFPRGPWLKILGSLKNKNYTSYLELGVFEGRSLLWIAENILSKNCRVVAVDHFVIGEGVFDRFNKNIESLRNKSEVTVHQGWVQDILPTLPAQDFDLIYVDADHSYYHVWNDLVRAWPLLKTGGYLVIDDYLWMKFLLPSAERPEKAVDDFLRLSEGSCRLLSKDTQVFVQKFGELPDSLKVIEKDSSQIPGDASLPPKKIGGFLLKILYFLYHVKRRFNYRLLN